MIREDHPSELIECSNADFIQTYLRRSFLDDTLVDSIVEKLRGGNVLLKNGWPDLRVENDTFAPLSRVASAIAKVAESCGVKGKRNFWVVSNPTKAGEFDTMGYRHFPDVRCVSNNTKIQLCCPERVANKNASNHIQPDEENEGRFSRAAHNVSVLGEIKLHDAKATAQDDEKKLLFAANEIMFDDPTRRFIFGFTIEATTMQIWFFCRSHIARCEKFNYHQEPRPFIKFLLAVMFGSWEQLGWDPTVTRLSKTVNGSNTIVYEYKIGRRTFHTIGNPISELSAYHLVSPATRVWKVEEVTRTGTSGSMYVLTDVWPYKDAKLEKEILRDIFKKLGEVDEENSRNGTPTAHVEAAKPFFLTILEDGPVTNTEGENDVTVLPPTYQQVQWTDAQQLCIRFSSRDLISDGLPLPDPYKLHVRRFERRKHVRRLVKEVCESVYELADMLQFIKCMKDVLQGLFYLRLAGYVHRDLSPGNCLFHLNQGKLSDVEFGKHESSCTVHDPIMGTREFMALEYATGKYLYVPQKGACLWTGPSTMPSLSLLSVDVDRRVIFNYYHDVESVAWIYLWFLHHRFPSLICEVLTPNKRAELRKLHEESRVYFQAGSALRMYVVTGISSILTELARRFISLYAGNEELVMPLALFEDLREAYENLEKEPQEPRTQDPCFHWPRSLFPLKLYETHIARFQAILDKQNSRGVFAMPVKHTRIYVQEDLKRPADDEVASAVPTKGPENGEQES
ncbi:hypothetical protein E1B28_000542 [Marasmius oreades]|uniref:Protein kinase domain-containing protein n=1 Tax=Marasmius oreades TaxID=181124 RepID=A0A9P7V1I0_9AGAR|nr:uncharacterized protein E1B28_000542 [Marasmius oreades]KAG7098620.1 hypothetical protein E1B28_000542 [Marasmius oreades]